MMELDQNRGFAELDGPAPRLEHRVSVRCSSRWARRRARSLRGQRSCSGCLVAASSSPRELLVRTITDHSVVVHLCVPQPQAHVRRAAATQLASPCRTSSHFGLARPARALARHDRAADQLLAAQTPRAPCARAHGTGRPAWPCIPGTSPFMSPRPRRFGEEQLLLRARKIQTHGERGPAGHREPLDRILPDVWLLPRRQDPSPRTCASVPLTVASRDCIGAIPLAFRS